MASIISGVFFQPPAPATRSARTINVHILRQQLASSARHGVRIEFEEVGQGDLFMSLIHTGELNKVNPFDYLDGNRLIYTRE